MLSDLLLYERLTLKHEFLPFDCGDSDLNEYLFQNSKSRKKKASTATSEAMLHQTSGL